MKNNIITLLLLLLFASGISQDMVYVVQNAYSKSIKKDELNEATTMKDINPGYPSSWITDYVSAEILVTYNEEVTRAEGANETLSAEQRGVLNAADIGSVVVIDVKYNKKNAITGVTVVDTMMYSARVVPEVEAEFIGGNEEMIKYFEEYAINRVPDEDGKPLPRTIVKFTINEEGEVTDARISKSSEDKGIDEYLLKVVEKMPKWRPAENSKGTKIKQDFEFSIGNNTGC